MYRATLAVLFSGGLDSAILLGDALRRGERVAPLYVSMGLFWEKEELLYARRFLEAIDQPELQDLVILDEPVTEMYGSHWSITGCNVPLAGTRDEEVYLPGRNVLLLSKALVWCHLHHVPRLALGSLASNPFPDATPSFFTGFQDIVNQAINGNVKIVLPFAGLHKTEVMQRGRDLPLEWTFSCIHPSGVFGPGHCAHCNKCGERRQAFMDAGLHDRTVYHGIPS